MDDKLRSFLDNIGLRRLVDELRYCQSRRQTWRTTRRIGRELHAAISDQVGKAEILQKLTGLALTGLAPDPGAGGEILPGTRLGSRQAPVFEVRAVREARRITDDGRLLNQVFVTLLQDRALEHDGETLPMRCGSTLVIDLGSLSVSYVVRKPIEDRRRIRRTLEYRARGAGYAPESAAATYFGAGREVFARLHAADHG
jgi:hypothetical protein